MILKLILTVILLGAAVVLLPRIVTSLFAASRIYTPDDAPSKGAAIVFGAGLWWDGTPSPVLRDRVATAAELYFSGKVEKLLMSGDNRFENYNEPASMRDYAISLGVPAEAIVMDFAGWRTYDTCYRAKAIFGLQEAILVTQNFHLPRALYTCRFLGLDAVGVDADRRDYRQSSLFYWNVREQLATVGALWDVHFARPLPVLGEPEPIFPELQ